MRVKKYVCMKEDHYFLSEDQNEAYDHMEEGSDHIIAEVILEDKKLHCQKLDEENEVEIEETVFED